jgi:hypothetical protein
MFCNTVKPSCRCKDGAYVYCSTEEGKLQCRNEKLAPAGLVKIFPEKRATVMRNNEKGAGCGEKYEYRPTGY